MKKNNNSSNLDVSFVGKIVSVTNDTIQKNGYEIILETDDKMYMLMVLCVNSLSYLERVIQGDYVYISGTLIYNCDEKGFGDPRLLLLVKDLKLKED